MLTDLRYLPISTDLISNTAPIITHGCTRTGLAQGLCWQGETRVELVLKIAEQQPINYPPQLVQQQQQRQQQCDCHLSIIKIAHTPRTLPVKPFQSAHIIVMHDREATGGERGEGGGAVGSRLVKVDSQRLVATPSNAQFIAPVSIFVACCCLRRLRLCRCLCVGVGVCVCVWEWE